MSIFSFKSDKGKYNLGNETDLNGIADGTAFNSIKALAGMIAEIENGATASRTYNKGEYILRNGRLYQVTSTIATGGTITEGVNIYQTTIGEMLSKTGGGGMPKLDYSNPLVVWSGGGGWTATQDCYVGGRFPNSGCDVYVNNHCVAGMDNLPISVVAQGGSSGINQTYYIPLNRTMPFIKVSQGDYIYVTAASPAIAAYAEIS